VGKGGRDTGQQENEAFLAVKAFVIEPGIVDSSAYT
jgi:hypothetical protein